MDAGFCWSTESALRESAVQSTFFEAFFLAMELLKIILILQLFKVAHWYSSDTVDGQNPAPPGMVKTLINNGIIIILGGAGFLPSTVSFPKSPWNCWSSGCFGTGPSSHHTPFWDLLLPSIGHMFSPLGLANKKVTRTCGIPIRRCFFEMRKLFSSLDDFNICVWCVKNPNWGPWNRDLSWTFSPDRKLSCMLHDLRGFGSILGSWNLKLKSSKKWIHLASFPLGSFEISILDA